MFKNSNLSPYPKPPSFQYLPRSTKTAVRKEHKPGNPPSLFRSQSVCFNTLTSFASSTLFPVSPSTWLVAFLFTFASVNSSTINVPPVLGWSATSPISVPKVERSSCANYLVVVRLEAWFKRFGSNKKGEGKQRGRWQVEKNRSESSKYLALISPIEDEMQIRFPCPWLPNRKVLCTSA